MNSERPRAVLIGRLTTTLAVGALLVGLSGCTSEPEPEPHSGLVGTAIDACLTAASVHNSYPVDGPGALTVTAEEDHQGWWAVNASVDTNEGPRALQCTAVPNGDGTARAASWNVK